MLQFLIAAAHRRDSVYIHGTNVPYLRKLILLSSDGAVARDTVILGLSVAKWLPACSKDELPLGIRRKGEESGFCLR